MTGFSVHELVRSKAGDGMFDKGMKIMLDDSSYLSPNQTPLNNNGALTTLIIFFSGVILLVIVAVGLLICKFYDDYNDKSRIGKNSSYSMKNDQNFDDDDDDENFVKIDGNYYFIPKKTKPKKIRTKTGKGHVIIYKEKLNFPYDLTIRGDFTEMAENGQFCRCSIDREYDSNNNHLFSTNIHQIENEDDQNSLNPRILSQNQEGVKTSKINDCDFHRRDEAANRYVESKNEILITSPEIFV
uniref:Uncharacterized protein n=1 Tax=Romanomermis culicivorax TaxID=13658 RepID=A0A915KXY9_ROMCU